MGISQEELFTEIRDFRVEVALLRGKVGLLEMEITRLNGENAHLKELR